MADPVHPDESPPGTSSPVHSGISSHADAQLELALEGLARSVAVLAINLKTHLKSPENAIFRGSLENQHRATLAAIQDVLVHPHAPWDDEANRAASDAVTALEATCARVPWLRGVDALQELFRSLVDRAFSQERLGREGPPGEAHSALLSRHATLPQPQSTVPATAQPPPAQPPPAHPASAAAPPSPPREILFERIFTFGDETQPHEAHVGELYLGFARHARGLSEDEARRTLTPAAVVGFAASIERALGTYRGVVAFRIVREAGRVGMELRRLAASPTPGGTADPSRP